MTTPGSWLRSWDDNGPTSTRTPQERWAETVVLPSHADDAWPTRIDLRGRLVAAGVDYVYADLLATLTQSGRPDLRDQVRRRLA